MEQDIVREFFENGGSIAYPQDGRVQLYVAQHEKWYILDQTMNDFFGENDFEGFAPDSPEKTAFFEYIANTWKNIVSTGGIGA